MMVGPDDDVRIGRRRGSTPMSDPQAGDPGTERELDEAVRASEQHVLAEEDADAGERVVRRDPDTHEMSEEPAQ
jgi:hypothetical protein